MLILNALQEPRRTKYSLLTGDDELRVVTKTKVGSSLNFFTGKKRMKVEETLLRELVFTRSRRMFTGVWSKVVVSNSAETFSS